MKIIKTILPIVTAIFTFALPICNKTALPSYAQACNKDYNELSITLLHPHIEKAIADYYGYARRYEIGDSELDIMERDGNVFTVKVTVDTFEGAHNDYFTEILTYKITPCDIALESYTHSDFIR